MVCSSQPETVVYDNDVGGEHNGGSDGNDDDDDVDAVDDTEDDDDEGFVRNEDESVSDDADKLGPTDCAHCGKELPFCAADGCSV
eukprot:jgi/Chrzof1/9124/Cz03g36250.t1